MAEGPESIADNAQIFLAALEDTMNGVKYAQAAEEKRSAQYAQLHDILEGTRHASAQSALESLAAAKEPLQLCMDEGTAAAAGIRAYLTERMGVAIPEHLA